METTGKILKKSLGLEKIKQVKICRAVNVPFRTYLIFYNTRRPTVPITQRNTLGGYMPSQALEFPFIKKSVYTPLIDIEDFNANLRPAIFFPIDMAGQIADPKMLTKIIEKNEDPIELKEHSQFFGSLNELKEFLTMVDLRGTDIYSSFTTRTRRQKNREVGTENRVAKLLDINIDTQEDHVTFIWLTEVTEPIYPQDYQFGEVDPNSSFRIKGNRSKTYELYVRILNFFEWLKTKPEGEELSTADLKEVFEVANIQVFSTSPSLHWQGGNYFLSQLDASIYPTNIAPEFWNKDEYHGSGPYLSDKHLMGILRNIEFWYSPMASMLNKKLKDRNLL